MLKRREFLIRFGGLTLVVPFGLASSGCSESNRGGGDDDDSGADDDDTGTDDDDTSSDDDDTGADDDDSGSDDDDTSSDDDDDDGCSGPATGSADSHGHQVTIPAADLDNYEASMGAKTYTSAGAGAAHHHEVTFSAADMESLRDCGTVITDDSEGHSHTWTVSRS